MENEQLKQIETLAKKLIIHLTHFTKPEFRESANDEDSWIGNVDSVTKSLPEFLELFRLVCDDETLAKMNDEDNAIHRRGFIRSNVESSELQALFIGKVISDNDTDLYLSWISSQVRQLLAGIAGIKEKKATVSNLAADVLKRKMPAREIERIDEEISGLTKLYKRLTFSLFFGKIRLKKMRALINKTLSKLSSRKQ